MPLLSGLIEALARSWSGLGGVVDVDVDRFGDPWDYPEQLVAVRAAEDLAFIPFPG
jgi:hypothetical protein